MEKENGARRPRVPHFRVSGSPSAEGLDDLLGHLLGVAEQHHRLVGEEQRVVDAGIARRQRPLEEQGGARLVGIENRHAVDVATRVGARHRVGDVVGADDEGNVGARELVVDLVEFEHLFVRHVGFGQQHVHVPRHSSGHGVNGVFDLDALLLQLVRHLAERVLGLGDGHAVARNDDHLRRVLHDEGRIVGATGLDAPVAHGPRRGRHAFTPEAAEQHVEDRPVHPLAHDVAEDRTGGADQRADDHQRRVLQGETDAGGRPARVRVEHRHHHRHVGAADRDDQQEADGERQKHQQPIGAIGLGGAEPDDHRQNGEADDRVQRMLHREGDRVAAHQALQLEERDHRSREGDRADGGAQRHLDQAAGVDAADRADAVGLRVIEGRRRHEHRRHTDQAVEGGDQLRQSGHLNALCDDGPDGATDQDTEDDHPVADHVGTEQRGDHGDHHAGDAEDVAHARGIGRAQAAQRHDEQNARDQVGEPGNCFSHGFALLLLLFLEHRQHALGHDETAEDIHRRQDHREEPHELREIEMRRPGGEQSADDDHRRNGVGHTHQRRVQRRRHAPHHVEADEARQHEDGEKAEEIGLRDGGLADDDLGRVAGELRRLRGQLRRLLGKLRRLINKSCRFHDYLASPVSIGFTTFPSRVSKVPLTVSSSQSNLNVLFSLSTWGLRKFRIFRANKELASLARRPGTLI